MKSFAQKQGTCLFISCRRMCSEQPKLLGQLGWKLEGKIIAWENNPVMLLWFNQLPLSFVPAFVALPRIVCVKLYFAVKYLAGTSGHLFLLAAALITCSQSVLARNSLSALTFYLLTQISAWQSYQPGVCWAIPGNTAVLLPQSTGSSLLRDGSPTMYQVPPSTFPFLPSPPSALKSSYCDRNR